MSIHYGLFSTKSSSVDLSDIEAKLSKKIKTNSERSILAKSKALEVEQDVAANKTSITTNYNYTQTNKTDILAVETKANTNRASIDLLNKHFQYEFSFYYVNIAYNTWHSPQPKVGGYPNPWVFFDTPTDNTKLKLLGHIFDSDSNIDTRSRVKMEYKIKILKDDGGCTIRCTIKIFSRKK